MRTLNEVYEGREDELTEHLRAILDETDKTDLESTQMARFMLRSVLEDLGESPEAIRGAAIMMSHLLEYLTICVGEAFEDNEVADTPDAMFRLGLLLFNGFSVPVGKLGALFLAHPAVQAARS